jgi:hypothetical protein
MSGQSHDHTKDAIAGLVEELATKVVSNPPPGKCKITNIYYDPDIDKYVIEREE